MTITVKITDIRPDTSEMSSDSVWFEFDGRTIQSEWWGTNNTSGQELYEDSEPVSHDTANEVFEAAEDLLEAAKERFYELWHERVQPVIDQIRDETLATHGGPFEVDVDEDGDPPEPDDMSGSSGNGDR